MVLVERIGFDSFMREIKLTGYGGLLSTDGWKAVHNWLDSTGSNIEFDVWYLIEFVTGYESWEDYQNKTPGGAVTLSQLEGQHKVFHLVSNRFVVLKGDLGHGLI